MKGGYRFTGISTSQRTHEWDRLPVLGASDRRGRQRLIRLAVAALGLVWVGVAAIVAVFHG